nr:fructose-bisphosphate aldolase 6, cytosolic [Tanacetum cinerariifolium]
MMMNSPDRCGGSISSDGEHVRALGDVTDGGRSSNRSSLITIIWVSEKTVQGTTKQISSAPEGKTVDRPSIQKYAAEGFMDGHRNGGQSSGSHGYNTGNNDEILRILVPRKLRSNLAKSQTQMVTSGISAEKIVQGKSKQISSAPEGKTVDEAVNEGSMSSSCLKLLSVVEQVSKKSALEKNLGEALKKTATDLSTGGKGILAADESARTKEKRFLDIQLEKNESNKRAFRELLFCTSDALQYLSGIIISEETLNQETEKGVPFLKIMKIAGVLLGIRVDKGTVELDGTNDETITEGLDGLDSMITVDTYMREERVDQFLGTSESIQDGNQACVVYLTARSSLWIFDAYSTLVHKQHSMDKTPSTGSSANAIICAVVGSRANMEEALQATKVFAEDYQSRGTAFLWSSFMSSPAKAVCVIQITSHGSSQSNKKVDDDLF